MADTISDKKVDSIGRLLGYAIGLTVAYFLLKLTSLWDVFAIDPAKEYTWLEGGFHGLWSPINWIRSFFADGVFCKAPLHTGGYSFWWWVSLIIAVLFLLNCTARIRSLFK